MLAMTSCSDDLGFVDSKGKITDTSKLIGVLEQKGTTRTGMVDDRSNNYPVVWSKGDRVNVYSLTEALTYAIYELESGVGTNTAVFAEPPVYADGIHELLGTSDKLYAVTSSPWVYGVSATMKDDQGKDLEDQKALLTVEIPTAFKWSEEKSTQFNNNKYYYNDAPYWGHVEGTTDGQMNVQFNKLVGAIKIDAALLPKGTKAVVIATKATMPLSGTFHSVLDIDNPADCKLVADKRLVNYNQIRADFDAFLPSTSKDHEANQRVFIMPLICGKYETLDVIAIINDEKDATFIGEKDAVGNTIKNETSYIPADGDRTYRGMEYNTMDEKGDWVRIRTFKNVEVTTDKVLAAYPAVEQNLDDLTPMQISERIALAYDGKHDFIFNISNIRLNDSYFVAGNGFTTDAYTLENDHTIYIPKNDPKEGQYRTASITLNFDETVKRSGNTNDHTLLYIKEANYNYNERTTLKVSVNERAANGTVLDTRGGLIGSVTGTTSNKLVGASNTYNVAAYATEAAAEVAKIDTRSAKSKRNIFINLTGVENAEETLDWDIYLPTSKLTLGNLDEDMAQYGDATDKAYGVIRVIADNSNKIDNIDGTAGVNVIGNFYQIDVLPAHDGGTIVKGTNAKAKNVTVQKLNIQNPAAALVKIDDASVADVTYVEQTAENPYLYTVGSAAIKNVEEKTSDKLRVRAFWTGKKLLQCQIDDLYDQSKIYTAAQLSSMGSLLTGTNVNNAVYNYFISTKLAYMHLGGDAYPWEAATINAGTTDFTLEGNAVNLRYMRLDDGNKVTAHGLINSVKAKNVTVKNINLFQAKVTKPESNIGALVGSVEATGDVKFSGDQNSVDEIDFTNTKNNVGGIVGNVKANTLTFDANKLIVNIYNVKGDNQIGGLVGNVETTGDVKLDAKKVVTVTVTSNNGEIAATGDNVGGAFGKVTKAANFRIWSKLDLNAKAIKAGGINAGGVAGYYYANGTDGLASFGGQTTGTIKVAATEITAGGFLTETSDKIAGNVGGLVGNADHGAFKVATNAAVTVNVGKMASICHVGGLVGLCNTTADVSGTASNQVVVTVGEFENTVGDAARYNSTEQKLAIGTFGGFVGRANAKLTIGSKDNNIVTANEDLLSMEARRDLKFNERRAEQVNVNGKRNEYWGDNSNYVGWVAEGQEYWLEGNRQMEGTDHNRYVTPETYED